MKNINYYLILLFIFFSTNLYANNKVAFVDIDYLINNSTIGKQIINQLENEDKKNIDILKKKISEFKIEKDKMVKNFSNLKNEELNKLLLKINKIIQEYMDENSIDIVFDKKKIYIGKTKIDITLKVLEDIEKKLK